MGVASRACDDAHNDLDGADQLIVQLPEGRQIEAAALARVPLGEQEASDAPGLPSVGAGHLQQSHQVGVFGGRRDVIAQRGGEPQAGGTGVSDDLFCSSGKAHSQEALGLTGERLVQFEQQGRGYIVAITISPSAV